MSASRKQNAFRNVIAGLSLNFTSTVATFVVQRLFINALGAYLLGVNSLFTSIIGIIAMSDLGIGSAVIFYMYRAFAENDKGRLVSLMRLYKKICHVISVIMLFLGIVVSFFIPKLISIDIPIVDIYIIWGLFVADAISAYLISYKRIVLAADQKQYVVSIIQIIYVVLVKATQAITLVVFKNFFVFLAISIVGKIIENIVITRAVHKLYPFVQTEKGTKLEAEVIKGVKKKTHGLVYMNISEYAIKATDNLLIGRMFGVMDVALYANYFLIVNGINMLFSQIFSALVGSVGHMLSREKKEYSFIVVKRMFFLDAWIFAWGSVCLYLLTEPFIQIWIGDGFLLARPVLLWVVIAFFLNGLKNVPKLVLGVGGITYENRFAQIAEMVANVVLSIAFGYFFGLAGIFVGTALSTLIQHLYNYPKYAFGTVLGQKFNVYLQIFFKYVLVSVIIFTFSVLIGERISFSTSIVTLAVRALFCMLLPNLLLYAVFAKTEELEYYIGLVKTRLASLRKFIKR